MLKNILIRRVVEGQLRHAVNGFGAYFATTGYASADDMQAITGAVMVIASMILSAMSGEKRS